MSTNHQASEAFRQEEVAQVRRMDAESQADGRYIQKRKTADEIVAELDAMMAERLARNFGNMTLWHDDCATLLRRYREMAGEIGTLRLQQQTDRHTIASLSAKVTGHQ